ncbi:hypothetical protein [Maricaulis sp.]|uniref:hypothetical protein n=1 Tax=Maricaulis sp. TaxID=1486257 RepID=UPI003298C69C
MATINHTQFAQALADELEAAGVTLDKSAFVEAFVDDLGNWVGAYTSNPVLAQRLLEVLARIDGILLSNGVPDEETGEVGAFAFDVQGKAFYGPKTEAGWGAAQAVLQGPPGEDGEEVSLQASATHIQWRLGTGAWQNLVALSAITGPAGADGADAEEISVQASATHIQWRRGEGAWVDIVALADLTGADGADGTNGTDGQEVDLQVTATHIQWRIGSEAWQNLIALADLKGEKGDPFDWDASGAYAGRSAFDGEAEDFAYLALDGAAGGGGPAVLYIKNSGTSGDWSDAVPFQGPAGVDAEEISVQASATHIQWRRGEGAWVNIVALADLAGADGDDGQEVSLQVTATHIQWRLGAGAWQNLIALTDLKGDTGPGLPTGGTAGQIPAKVDGTDFNIEWIDPPTGGGMQVAEIQTAAFTPEIGMAYPVSTAGGPVTLTALPAGAEQGDRFELHDSGRSWGETNKVIVPGDPYDTWLTNVGGVVMFEHDGTGWQIYIQSGDDPADYLEQHVARPSIISPVNGATDVGESPTIESSVFAVVNGVDTQIAAGWKITSDAAGETVVVQSLADAVNLTSWTVPIGNLTPSTGFYAWVMHTGATYGDSAWSLAGSFTTAAVFMDPDAQVIINAMSSTPSGARQSLIEDLVDGLKADGIWAKLDALWVLAAHDSQAAALNWMDPAGSPILPVNAPVFTADRGFKGDNTSTHLDTQFVPGTDGVNFVQDSASAGIWVREVASDNGDIYLGTGDNSSSSTFTRIQRRSDGVEWRVWGPNGGLLDGGTDSEVATGLLVADRSGATAFHTYRNGALENTGSAASGSPSPYSVYLLAANGSGAAGSQSDAQLSAAFLGGSLTGTEHGNLHTRLNTYLTAVGAV